MRFRLCSAWLFAVLASACATLPPKPPAPKTLAFDLVACVITATEPPPGLMCQGVPNPTFKLHISTNPDVYYKAVGDGAGYASVSGFPDIPDSDITITSASTLDDARSFSPQVFAANSAAGHHNMLLVAPRPQLFPDPPTREQVLTSHLTFQGLTVHTKQYGDLPWFEAALVSLNAEDRQAVYAAKHAAGDTACILAFAWSYNEPGQPYANIPGADFTGRIPDFVALVEEVIWAGFVPRIVLGGDDGERGFQIATAQLQALVPALQNAPSGVDLSQYGSIVPGWDGVFYGYTPAHIQAFGQLFRHLLPHGYLGIEFNTGHIPVGNGPSDYVPGGMMTDYDLLIFEGDNWPMRGDAEWQVLARLLGRTSLGGTYVRPPDQPADDDPRPPWYLAPGTPRGPYVVDCFEWAEYPWVRSRVTAAQIAEGRAYYRALGCGVVG